MAYINEDTWMEYLGGMKEIFNKIGASFLDSYSNFENNVLDTMNNKKESELYNHIHSLKGITLNLGMNQLYDSCVEVLGFLKQNIVDEEKIKNLLEVFKASYAELKSIIS